MIFCLFRPKYSQKAVLFKDFGQKNFGLLAGAVFW
jgi:hypothetical protein